MDRVLFRLLSEVTVERFDAAGECGAQSTEVVLPTEDGRERRLRCVARAGSAQPSSLPGSFTRGSWLRSFVSDGGD